MDTIYITGHRNPDTDSIVSAMAYAALKNALGQRQYEAARLGQISDETQTVLDRFGFQPPKLLNNVRTQVRDLDYDTPATLSAAATISRAWRTMQKDKISAIPVANEDGTLFGMLSAGDVANYDMSSVRNPKVGEIPVYNLLSVLEGKILNQGGEMRDVISGEVTIALPASRENLVFSDPGSIVVCGDQPDMIRRALEIGVSCIIVCQAEVDPELLAMQTDTCIISTAYDAYRAVRLIYHAMPISSICKNKDLVCFHLDDYIDDVQNTVLESRFRAYPILDEEERVVGTLSRYHLLRPRRKQVILMDHNEKAQSVPGLDQAEILEIIDHHRLADIQTKNPITVRNEPVGSTTTIVAGMYQDKGLMPTAKMAGLMAAAIVSDTVMFKSPTCTQRDIDVANRMARIANISLQALGQVIFSASGSQTYTVGIIQQVQHEALDAATQGFQDALTELLGDSVTIDPQNASGDTANCTTIANNFVSQGVDLIMANGTTALQAAATGTSTIPILGTSITEYGVALGIDGFTGTTGYNVSGTSDLAPLDQQAEMLHTWFPDAQTVGLLYCSAEPNSQYQVDTVQGYLEDLGYTCTQYSFSDSNDLSAVASSACTASDVLYVPTDNTAANNAELIGNISLDTGTPIIAGEEGICKGCGVATLTISYYDIGYKTGEMAYDILVNGADPATMPIEYAPQFTPKYNPTMCEALGLTPPDGYEAIAE